MIKKINVMQKSPLDMEMERVISEMNKLNPGTEEYSTMATNLDRLCKVYEQQRKRKISPDTLAVVGGSFMNLVLIMNYERANILTTKAMGFVLRGRA